MTTRYVNTDSTAGGDGTTNATTGANRAYASLSEWEANEQSSLTEDHTVWCDGSSDDTNVYVFGWTNNSYYIIIRANTGAEAVSNGAVNSSAFTLKTDVTGTVTYRLNESHIKTYDLTIDCGNNTSSNSVEIWNATDVIFDRCVFKNGGAASGVIQPVTNTVFQNTMFIQTPYVFGAAKLVNCSSFGDTTNGIMYRDAECTNCVAVFTGSRSYADFFNCTGDYNSSSDTSSPGANSLNSKGLSDVDFVNTTSGSEDLHIQSTSDLVGQGVGPSTDADVPTADINGDTRSGTTCDIGCDEYTAASTTIPIFMHHYTKNLG